MFTDRTQQVSKYVYSQEKNDNLMNRKKHNKV